MTRKEQMSALTNRATILNSYTLGDVHADTDQTNRAEAGGFIALAGGVCVNCYAMGNVEIASKYSMYLGGFVGMAASASETRQCYYNTDADQTVAGKPAEEKHFAGKYVNAAVDEPEQAKTAEEIGSEAFCTLLNGNRLSISQTLAEIGEELGADENGSSQYQSIYYRGDGSDLLEWVVLEDHAGFAWPKQPPVNPFEDVKEGKYYYDAVLWAVEKGITAGTSETTFSPKKSCTRAEIVTFLYRFAGAPNPEGTACPFTDVKKGSFYYKAVLWAFENGVTAGTTPSTFTPKKNCTRAEAVTFLYRLANK